MVEVKINSTRFFDLLMVDQLHDFGGSRAEKSIDFQTIRNIWQDVGYSPGFDIPEKWQTSTGKRPPLIRSKTEGFVHMIFDTILEYEGITTHVESLFEILTLNTIPDESPFTDSIRAQLFCPDGKEGLKYPEKWLKDWSGRKPKLPVKFFVDAEVGKSIGLRLAQLKYSQGEMVTISKFYDQAQTENLLQTANYISLCNNNIIAMKQEDHEEIIKSNSCENLPYTRDYRIETKNATLEYTLDWEKFKDKKDRELTIPIVTELRLKTADDEVVMTDEIRDVILKSYDKGGPSVANVSKILNEYYSEDMNRETDSEKLKKLKFCCLLSKSLGDLSQLLDFYWYNGNREKGIDNYYLVTNDKSLLNIAYFLGYKGNLRISNPFVATSSMDVVEGKLGNIIDRIFWSRPDKGNFKKTTYITKRWKEQYRKLLKEYDDQEAILRGGESEAMKLLPPYKTSCGARWDVLEPSSEIMTSEESEVFEDWFEKAVKEGEIIVFEEADYEIVDDEAYFDAQE